MEKINLKAAEARVAETLGDAEALHVALATGVLTCAEPGQLDYSALRHWLSLEKIRHAAGTDNDGDGVWIDEQLALSILGIHEFREIDDLAKTKKLRALTEINPGRQDRIVYERSSVIKLRQELDRAPAKAAPTYPSIFLHDERGRPIG